MVLEAIYEQDFLPCLYGFRPGRSAHQITTRLSILVRKVLGRGTSRHLHQKIESIITYFNAQWLPVDDRTASR
jgi:hypothetical protein